jgi:hypothetical protein
MNWKEEGHIYKTAWALRKNFVELKVSGHSNEEIKYQMTGQSELEELIIKVLDLYDVLIETGAEIQDFMFLLGTLGKLPDSAINGMLECDGYTKDELIIGGLKITGMLN